VPWKGGGFSAGAIPARPLSLRPVALEAVEGGNDFC
jgi:hypothetical protein